MASNKKKTGPVKVGKESYLEVNPDELWLHTTIAKKFYDAKFYRIINFYVLHSPCKSSSYTPMTFEKLGWKNQWNSNKFREIFDSVPGFVEGDTFCHHGSRNHFLELWNSKGYEDFFSTEGEEFAIFSEAGEANPRMDVLHHIRNAFAHGRYSAKKVGGEYYIYFEDVTKIKGLTGLFVVARICLKKSTLIEWLDIFEKKSPKANELSSLFIKCEKK